MFNSVGMRRRAALLGGAAVAMALCGAAHAADGAAADAGDGVGLEEVVVTAEKRVTDLQTTPVAMSVLGDQALAQRHVQSLADLMTSGPPSLRIAPFISRNSALTVGIRGIVPFDANQPSRDGGVGVYIDGPLAGPGRGPIRHRAD